MTDQKRIVFFCATYPPVHGGVARHVADLARMMHKAGFDVYVITRQTSSTPVQATIQGIKVKRIPVTKFRIAASISFTIQALYLFIRIKPDVIHSHELHLTSLVGIIARILLRIPLIVTIHTAGPLIGDIAVVKRAFLSGIRLAIFRRFVDKYIAISSILDKEMEAAGFHQNKRILIPNGIDTMLYTPADADTKYRLRQKLSLPDGPIVIASGRLVWEKRVQNLLEVWPKIRQQVPNAWLLVIGSGEYEDDFRNRGVGGVILAGEVMDSSAYIRASDVLAMLSIYEGFSLSALEGLACGLPVVATPVGAIPQLITHGTNGWIVPVDDLDALEGAVLTLLERPKLRLELGQRAREWVSCEYSLQTLSDKLITLYKELMNQPG